LRRRAAVSAAAERLGARPRLRRTRLSAFVLAALLLPARLGGLHAESLGLAAKATHLQMLARFVVWPAAAFAGPASPFLICIQGPDPFGDLLDRDVAGQRVDARPIIIERLAKLDAASGCQLAYVAGSARQSRAAALEAVRGAPVLTVTDDAEGPGPRGIVHFVVTRGRVGFQVDTRSADAAGVTISSKLLALAVQVVR
jgi:hypothetical protein